MPDNDQFPRIPEAKAVPKKRTHLSLVWVIPIVAAVAGIWIAVTRILNQGPEITIVFQSAEGLEASKTKVQYNGLNVGTLTDIRLADDHKQVIATARMDPKAKEFLVKDTQFWVVRPRISGLNISGLGTLLSGHYIGVELGKSRERERNFVALENPPLVARDAPGRFLMLKTSDLGSLGDAAPIYFRHIEVGEIVSHELDKSGQFMSIKAFVKAPYDQYVTPDTRFWQASGIDVSLSANGLRVQTESLMSILGGGIAFETPAAGTLLSSTETNAPFTLFRNRTEAFSPPARHPVAYLIVFKQSVRGLVVGAPVELSGVPIGEVTEIHAQFDNKTLEFSVPVTISVDPARFGVKLIDPAEGADWMAEHKRVMDTVVARGLRAQLKTGSLISGSLYVAVDFHPEAPPASLDWAQNPVQLPAVPGQLEAIEASVVNIIKKLDQMQFKEISDDLRKTIGDLDKTLVGAHGTLTNVDTVMGSADKLLKSADKLVEPNSVLLGELGGLLQEAGGAARGLRLLADYLERHPEALIRGKTGDAK